MSSPRSIILLSFVIACAPRPPVQLVPPPAAGPRLKIFVYQIGATSQVLLPGVAVTGITVDGRELQLGTTTAGSITLEKDKLRAENVRLLLFCARYFECVALRVEEQQLYEFDEYYVDLPQVNY